ncbi:multiheme c-type cytochrome, partial [Planctomycetota bacterium]
TESKHGAIYEAEGHGWNWDAAPGTWTPGVDYRAPSCSVCHMSGVKSVATTHDVTERLAWETQAPLTVRPSEFKPWPLGGNPGRRCLRGHAGWPTEDGSRLFSVPLPGLDERALHTSR